MLKTNAFWHNFAATGKESQKPNPFLKPMRQNQRRNKPKNQNINTEKRQKYRKKNKISEQGIK